MTFEKKLKVLQRKSGLAELGGGKDRIEAQHKSGKLTARERINLLSLPHLKELRDELLFILLRSYSCCCDLYCCLNPERS